MVRLFRDPDLMVNPFEHGLKCDKVTDKYLDELIEYYCENYERNMNECQLSNYPEPGLPLTQEEIKNGMM